MFRSAGAQKYLKNTSWMFVDRVVRLASVFVTGIVMARVLGDDNFGHLNYASGFVGLFFALTAMGLEEIVVRDLVRHPERRDQLLGSAALLKFLGGVTLTLVVYLGSVLNHMDGFTTTMVMIIALSELLKPLSVVEYYFQSQVKGRLIAQVNIAQTAASSIFKLALCFAHAPLMWFAWSYVIDTLAAAIGFLFAYDRTGASWRKWVPSRTMMGALLGQSWPLIVFGIALYVQAKIDQVMIFDVLKHIMPEKQAYAEVGQYTVALKMIEALGFVPVIVQKSLAPAITRARMEGPEKYNDRLLNFYRLMFLLFLLTAVPLFFIAPYAIPFFFGETYTEAGVLLSLFAVRLFFTNMGVAKSSFITNESLFKYSLVTAVVGAGVNIALNYVLIPRWESRGAIVATIVSFAISIFLVDLCYKATRPNLKLMVQGIGTFWKLHRFT